MVQEEKSLDFAQAQSGNVSHNTEVHALLIVISFLLLSHYGVFKCHQKEKVARVEKVSGPSVTYR